MYIYIYINMCVLYPQRMVWETKETMLVEQSFALLVVRFPKIKQQIWKAVVPDLPSKSPCTIDVPTVKYPLLSLVPTAWKSKFTKIIWEFCIKIIIVIYSWFSHDNFTSLNLKITMNIQKKKLTSKKKIKKIPNIKKKSHICRCFFHVFSHMFWSFSRWIPPRFGWCLRGAWSTWRATLAHVGLGGCSAVIRCRRGRRGKVKKGEDRWRNDLIGGLEHGSCVFSISYIGCHPSHWRTHIFQDG
jgi:hypothetical protein